MLSPLVPAPVSLSVISVPLTTGKEKPHQREAASAEPSETTSLPDAAGGSPSLAQHTPQAVLEHLGQPEEVTQFCSTASRTYLSKLSG